MKSKKQDNIGVAPLKRSGGLTNESKEKAEILSNQFQSVFTRQKQSIPTTVLQQRAGSTMQHLKITVEGVETLLKNTNTSKSTGPDRIPNTILKTCAEELAPCLGNISKNQWTAVLYQTIGSVQTLLQDFKKVMSMQRKIINQYI
jgi:hypothetical protein